MSDIPSDCYRLSEEQRSYAAKHLNEEDTVKESKIEELRHWLSSGGGICTCVVFRVDDFFLLRFLRACKFDVEATKRKIKNYYEQRCKMSEWYSGRNPFAPEVQELLKLGVCFPLRNYDEKGRSVILIRGCIHDPKKHKMSNVIKTIIMLLDVAMKSDLFSTLYGIITIIDLEGVSVGHAMQLPPHVLKQLVHAWQDCYPLRIQAIHFIKPPTFLNVILNILKSFMKPKLRQRVHIHSQYTVTLPKQVAAEILPPEYRGTSETLDTLKEYWKNMAEDNKSWYAEDESSSRLWVERNRKNCLSK